MTLADLGTKSVRRNALIADLLHRIDFIEKAGTGVKRIRDEAREGGYPEPICEANGFTTAIFRPSPEVRAATQTQSGSVSGPGEGPVGAQSEVHDEAHDEAHEPITPVERSILAACRKGPATAPQLLQALGYSARTGNFKRALARLLTRGVVARTHPDRPRAKNQRYRITDTGRALLAKSEPTRRNDTPTSWLRSRTGGAHASCSDRSAPGPRSAALAPQGKCHQRRHKRTRQPSTNSRTPTTSCSSDSSTSTPRPTRTAYYCVTSGRCFTEQGRYSDEVHDGGYSEPR
jgi:DNA-binding MarR family transcriptional regulator